MHAVIIDILHDADHLAKIPTAPNSLTERAAPRSVLGDAKSGKQTLAGRAVGSVIEIGGGVIGLGMQYPSIQNRTAFKAFVKGNFLPWIETNRSAQTYQSYDWRRDVLIKEFGKLDLFEVSDFAIEKFKREEMKRKTRLGETQSPASVNRFLQILSSIFTRAEESKLITEKQRPKITLLKEGNEQIRYMTLDDYKKLVEAARDLHPTLHDLIVIGVATGLRRSELFNLEKRHVDLNLRLVNVLDRKGGKARSVPIDPGDEAYSILERRKREGKSDFIVPNPHTGKPYTCVTKSLDAACGAAKIERITLHWLRHTFGTWHIMAGTDVRTLQGLMGHEDIETTMIYVHLVESHKHEAARALGAFKKNCHKITTEEVGNVVAISA
ncbi:MAG TPA: site-specific integrase [Blastocatellia bacterium]